MYYLFTINIFRRVDWHPDIFCR